MEQEPAATAPALTRYAPAVPPFFTLTATTSSAAIALFVIVNETGVWCDSDALCIVIWPQIALSVTAVALLVSCVTTPPAPVAYPTPADAEVERMELAAVTAPAFVTWNRATPPISRLMRNEPAAEAVSVTSSLMPEKVVAMLFQIATRSAAEAPTSALAVIFLVSDPPTSTIGSTSTAESTSICASELNCVIFLVAISRPEAWSSPPHRLGGCQVWTSSRPLDRADAACGSIQSRAASPCRSQAGEAGPQSWASWA